MKQLDIGYTINAYGDIVGCSYGNYKKKFTEQQREVIEALYHEYVRKPEQ